MDIKIFGKYKGAHFFRKCERYQEIISEVLNQVHILTICIHSYRGAPEM